MWMEAGGGGSSVKPFAGISCRFAGMLGGVLEGTRSSFSLLKERAGTVTRAA